MGIYNVGGPGSGVGETRITSLGLSSEVFVDNRVSGLRRRITVVEVL